MNLKFTGIIMLALSGVISAVYIKANGEKKILALSEFIKNLDYIYNCISLYKMTVYEILKSLSAQADNILKEFYLNIYMLSDKEGIENACHKTMEDNSLFNDRSKEIICDFFSSFGTVPYESQLSEIEGTSLLLKDELESLKINSEKNLKVKSSLALGGALMLAIILM